MKRGASPVPEGMHTVTSYLTVPGVDRLIEFLGQAFDAKKIGDIFRGPDGRIMHAEMKIGNTIVMMGEPMNPWPARPCNLYLYVPDVDNAYRRATQAGGKSLSEPKDQFYGDRSAAVEDPSGNVWWIATHIEDVSPEEMRKRMEALSGSH
jgi:uncharacterized glyoxalase superfamily protein PhnB